MATVLIVVKKGSALDRNIQDARDRERLRRLTPTEDKVFRLVVEGTLNKVIAARLGTTEKTVKVHRGRVMGKLGVRSVSELVRIAVRLGVIPLRDILDPDVQNALDEERFSLLTRAERVIFKFVAKGILNRVTAAQLGVKERTVKAHRTKVHRKLRVNSTPELVRMAIRLRKIKLYW